MNILLVTRWYPSILSETSGIFIQKQAEVMSSVMNVTVIYINVDYSKYNIRTKVQRNYEKISDSLEVYRVIFSRSVPVYNQFNFIYNASKQILKLCKGKNYDLIHCHVTFQAGLIGLILSRRMKLPLVITEHSNWHDNFFPSAIHRFLSSYSLKRANRVVAVSKYSSILLQKHVKRDYDIIHNFIDLTIFKKDEKLIRHEVIQIGFLGGLDTRIKGLDILLQALARCTDLNYKLHIGGDGKLLPDYIKLAHKLGITGNCYFYGKILPIEVSTFYQKLDFFVLSSRTESFGVVLLEALASGLPVIATRCGGPEEIVTIETGILVDKEDVRSLEEGLRLMCNRYADYTKSYLRQYVESKFGKNYFLSTLFAIYKQEIDKYTNK